MTQSINDFVKSVVSGKTQFAVAGRAGGKIIEYTAKPTASDIEAIAAEAINRGIVDSDIAWARLVKQISDIISGLK